MLVKGQARNVGTLRIQMDTGLRQQLQRIKCKDEKMYISMADNDYEAMIGQELVSQSPQFPVTWTPKILTKVEHQGVSNPALTHPL